MSTVRLKHVCGVVELRAGSSRPPLLAVSIHHGVVPRNELTKDEPRADDLSTYRVCEPGDIVLNRMRAFQGAIGMAPLRGLVSPDYLVLRPRPEALGRYLHYLFRSGEFVGQMISRLRGIGSADTGTVRTPRINAEDLLDIDVRLPPLDEQRGIADYLDRETARIDALIAAKRRMSELMDELFDAHVSTTIWSNVPRRRLKYLARSPTSGNRDHSSFTPTDVGVACLRGLNVRPGEIDRANLFRIDPADHARHSATKLRAGDVVVVRSGLAGSGAVVPEDLDDCNCVDLVIIRRSPKLMPRYLEYVINSREAREQVARTSVGALLTHFNAVDAADLEVPYRDLVAQANVVAELDSDRRRRDDIVDRLNRQTSLLSEHRGALVTAVVTGDVRVPVAA